MEYTVLFSLEKNKHAENASYIGADKNTFNPITYTFQFGKLK